jgi:thymidylate synthase
LFCERRKKYKKLKPVYPISMKQYLDLVRCKRCQEQGQVQKCFGYQMRFDLSEGFPMVTTKNYTKIYCLQLLWFLKGDTKYTFKKTGKIWDSWADKMATLDLRTPVAQLEQ